MIRARNEFTGLCYPLLILPWISLPLHSLCPAFVGFYPPSPSRYFVRPSRRFSLFLVRFLWSSSWDPSDRRHWSARKGTRARIRFHPCYVWRQNGDDISSWLGGNRARKYIYIGDKDWHKLKLALLYYFYSNLFVTFEECNLNKALYTCDRKKW